MKELHDLAEGHGKALDALLEVVVLLGDDMARSLAREGLTVPRAHLLWRLHHDGPMTQRALADALSVSPRNITGLVDGLVATGFVTRERHPTDRRAILVTPTKHATATLAELDSGHRDLAELLFGDMSEQGFSAFAAGLGHVTSRLRDTLGPAPANAR